MIVHKIPMLPHPQYPVITDLDLVRRFRILPPLNSNQSSLKKDMEGRKELSDLLVNPPNFWHQDIQFPPRETLVMNFQGAFKRPEPRLPLPKMIAENYEEEKRDISVN